MVGWHARGQKAVGWMAIAAAGTVSQIAVTVHALRVDAWDSNKASRIHFGVFLLLAVLTVASYIRTFITSPGGVDDWHLLRLATDSEAPASSCVPCGSDKPERVHHCRVCGVCVLRYDHHCVSVCVSALRLIRVLLPLLT